jgi:hypothetical protein
VSSARRGDGNRRLPSGLMPRVGERGSYAWQQRGLPALLHDDRPHAGISLTRDDSERVQLSLRYSFTLVRGERPLAEHVHCICLPGGRPSTWVMFTIGTSGTLVPVNCPVPPG